MVSPAHFLLFLGFAFFLAATTTTAENTAPKVSIEELKRLLPGHAHPDGLHAVAVETNDGKTKANTKVKGYTKVKDGKAGAKGWYDCNCDPWGNNCEDICWEDDYSDDVGKIGTGIIIAIVATLIFFFAIIALVVCYCCACCCFMGRAAHRKAKGQPAQQPQVIVMPQQQQPGGYNYGGQAPPSGGVGGGAPAPGFYPPQQHGQKSA